MKIMKFSNAFIKLLTENSQKIDRRKKKKNREKRKRHGTLINVHIVLIVIQQNKRSPGIFKHL